MDRLYGFSQFVSDHTTYVNYIVDPVTKYAVAPVTNLFIDCISNKDRVNLIFTSLQKDSVKKAAAPLTIRAILVLGSSYFLKTTKLKSSPFLTTTAAAVLFYAFFTSFKFLQTASHTLEEILKSIEKNIHQPSVVTAMLELYARITIEAVDQALAQLEPLALQDVKKAYPSMTSSEEKAVKAKITEELQKLKKHCLAQAPKTFSEKDLEKLRQEVIASLQSLSCMFDK